MINQNFLREMTINGQTHNLNAREYFPGDNRFLVKKGDRIPYLLCFTQGREIRIPKQNNCFFKTMDLETVIRVFQEGNEVIFVPVRYRHYYVGKGIILDSNFNVLAMITVTEQYYHIYVETGELTMDHILEHFTLVVNTAFETQSEHKSLFARFRKLYKSQPFNIHFTRNPQRDSFVSYSPPVFETISARQEFIEDFKKAFAEDFLT